MRSSVIGVFGVGMWLGVLACVAPGSAPSPEPLPAVANSAAGRPDVVVWVSIGGLTPESIPA